MKTKFNVLCALGLGVQGASSFLKNTDWPKYTVVSSAATYLDPKLHSKGYACLRNNFMWAFPQKLTANIPATDASLRTFYASTTNHLGTTTADGVAPSATDSTSCCAIASMTTTGCATVSHTVSAT